MEFLSWLWRELERGERSEEESLSQAKESEYDNWFVEQALYEEGERRVLQHQTSKEDSLLYDDSCEEGCDQEDAASVEEEEGAGEESGLMSDNLPAFPSEYDHDEEHETFRDMMKTDVLNYNRMIAHNLGLIAEQLDEIRMVLDEHLLEITKALNRLPE